MITVRLIKETLYSVSVCFLVMLINTVLGRFFNVCFACDFSFDDFKNLISF